MHVSNLIPSLQVTDSESAQISLPCGKYLVRVATNNGPGSYPIIIDTEVCEISKTSISDPTKAVDLDDEIKGLKVILCLLLSIGLIFCIITVAGPYLNTENRIKNGKESKKEVITIHVKTEMMKEGKIQKDQGVLKIYPNSINVLSLKGVKVSAIILNAKTNTKDANVIQKT